MNKKMYQELKVAIVNICVSDIITESNDNDGQWIWEGFEV